MKESHYGQAIRVLDKVIRLLQRTQARQRSTRRPSSEISRMSQGIQGNLILAKENFRSAISNLKPTVKNAPLLGSLYISFGSQFATEGLLLNRVHQEEEGTKFLEKALGVFPKAEPVYSKVPLIIPHIEEAKQKSLLNKVESEYI